jgi:hypothetical protein
LAGDLKDQLKAWKDEHQPAPKQVEQKTPGLTPKQARRAAERARLEALEAEARAREEELEHLSDDELFEKAVSDIGDGSAAILQKYGHGHLSGEGEPAAAPRKPQKAEPPPPDENGKPTASETNLFLDFVGQTKPVK